MLLLPDQYDVKVEQHFAFSRRFGSLKTDLKAETAPDGRQEIVLYSNKKQGGKNVGTLRRRKCWHIALFLGKLLPVTGILRAKIFAEGGGPDMANH